MSKIKFLAICAIAVFTVTSAKAQFATGADIVSSYVWRGVPQEGTKGTPNIQLIREHMLREGRHFL